MALRFTVRHVGWNAVNRPAPQPLALGNRLAEAVDGGSQRLVEGMAMPCPRGDHFVCLPSGAVR